eukprot:Nitzschia sp. Nitz4//scaffold16_size188269//76241//77716//NITZ4_001792-RA/size188269-processed-gene-0.51-mRNA-1//1//CDS//3329538520//8763//frame0
MLGRESLAFDVRSNHVPEVATTTKRGMLHSSTALSAMRQKSSEEVAHVTHQLKYYDSLWADNSFMERMYKGDVYQAMANEMVDRLLSSNSSETNTSGETVLNILDVGCGTGVLWEYLAGAAKQANATLNITAVDFSHTMVDIANYTAETVMGPEENRTGDVMIYLVHQDIVDYCDEFRTSSGLDLVFDGAIVNNCFGNFWDPRAVLEILPAKKLMVSAPSGLEEVSVEHQDNTRVVPHATPTSTMDMVSKWTLGLPLATTYFSKASDNYYLMELEHVSYRSLPRVQRYRGTVDNGYGRGGKKLGVPTANLPSSLFQNALESVDTGVYFGWATLEEESQDGSPASFKGPFKAVVNVGFSPTFAGQENAEKIIEAHLIADPSSGGPTIDKDFYGQVMRLELAGFVRPERKFDGFPQLIAQIHADVDNSRKALDNTPYRELQYGSFIQGTSNSADNKDVAMTWIGSGGGDIKASWEFADFTEALEDGLKKTPPF